MSRRKSVVATAALACGVLAASLGSLPAASASQSPATPDQTSSSPAPADTKRVLHVPVALSQPVGLSEAIDIAEASSTPIVGYRFENDGVVGEYFPNGQQPEEFRQTYIADFGMEPRIVGLVKEVAVDFDAKPGAERSPETLEVDAGLSARGVRNGSVTTDR